MQKFPFLLSISLLLAAAAASGDALPDWLDIHGQATVIPQVHGPFHAPYAGPHSLANDTDLETTYTATLLTEARLWHGAEFHFDPEMTAGGGLSGGTGLAGITNGDVTRVGTRALRVYMARLYLRQTIGLGEDFDKNHMVWTVGKFSVTDIFDNNTYSHDARSQFMNWGFMANSAWDYPADTRGYTWGAATEISVDSWTWRGGGFLMPQQANGAQLETDPTRASGEVMELERCYKIMRHPGAVRLLGYYNQADMGDYRTAINEMPVSPDVTLTRTPGNRKYGFGLNAEQELTSDLGAFSRLGWNDGHTETWAFDEVDRTASIGLSLKGTSWKRSDDVVGLGFLINGLSGDHEDYLAAGGSGFLLGDGRLNYGTENIVEIYYKWQILKFVSLTADFQGIDHPGYNKDRGPVAVEALRLHLEF